MREGEDSSGEAGDEGERGQPEVIGADVRDANGIMETAPREHEDGRTRRRRLPAERQAITHKFSISGHEGYLTVGMFEDGTPGELFVSMAKQGSALSGLLDAFATMTSVSLQYGVPLHVLVRKFAHTRYEPSGFTENPALPTATSVTDYIFRWLALKFLPAGGEAPVAAGDGS